MTDPAIAAAQRAWEARGAIGWGDPNAACVSGAREALAPLRELHRRHDSFCAEDGCTWPCDSARLIYPESEL